jgi:hypothetical protein
MLDSNQSQHTLDALKYEETYRSFLTERQKQISVNSMDILSNS